MRRLSLTNVLVPVHQKTDYKLVLCSEDEAYGGHGLVEHMTYPVKEFDGKYYVELYIPARTAIILEEGPVIKDAPKKPVVEPPAIYTKAAAKTEKKTKK